MRWEIRVFTFLLQSQKSTCFSPEVLGLRRLHGGQVVAYLHRAPLHAGLAIH
jgi:hypothetical protein